MALPFDLDALHRYLYRRTDPFGRCRLDLKGLAAELEVSYPNLSLVITRMTNEGRLRRIGGSKYGRKTYQVTDPALWVDVG